MHTRRHQAVGCETLKSPYLNRLSFGGFSDACLFAKRLGWTNPGAHAAQNVLFKDRLRRAIRLA
jgi:hypothetical protein